MKQWFAVKPLGDFNFWLSLSLSLYTELKFGLSPDLSQKVKWFCWAKDLDQIYSLSTDLTEVKLNFGLVRTLAFSLRFRSAIRWAKG